MRVRFPWRANDWYYFQRRSHYFSQIDSNLECLSSRTATPRVSSLPSKECWWHSVAIVQATNRNNFNLNLPPHDLSLWNPHTSHWAGFHFIPFRFLSFPSLDESDSSFEWVKFRNLYEYHKVPRFAIPQPTTSFSYKLKFFVNFLLQFYLLLKLFPGTI